MPQPRRSDKPANAVVAFRATAAELAELDRLVAELPGLSERSRGAVLRHLAHEAAHGAVVPLTDEDRMVLGAMLAKRAAELARLGFHDLVPHLTPGRMLQALLRAQAAPVAVVAPVEPVAVVAHEAPLDVEHEAPVAVVAPVEPVAVVAHEAPLDVEHEAPVAVVAPVEPVAPVVAHEAPLAAAAVRAAVRAAVAAGERQTPLGKEAGIDSGLMSRFMGEKQPLSAAKLTKLAAILREKGYLR